MNRLTQLFEGNPQRLLNVYFTAGFPELEDTVPTIKGLAEAGVDVIEIGMPYSDPLADGPTIQASNQQALDNGISLDKLFGQVAEARKEVETPLIMMGYFNQVMQYGEEKFVARCAEIGVDGLILPDLPLDVYEEQYREMMEAHGLGVSFLISPQTSDARIRQIDSLSHGFIYMVSSSSITGGQSGLDGRKAYFERINNMDLETPRMIGFGISTASDFDLVSEYASGAVVGSAFIRALEQRVPISDFVTGLKGIPQTDPTH